MSNLLYFHLFCILLLVLFNYGNTYPVNHSQARLTRSSTDTTGDEEKGDKSTVTGNNDANSTNDTNNGKSDGKKYTLDDYKPYKQGCRGWTGIPNCD